MTDARPSKMTDARLPGTADGDSRVVIRRAGGGGEADAGYGPELRPRIDEILDAAGFAIRGKRVLVKPNLVTAASAASGITADIAFCRAVLDRLEDCEVTVANDSPGGLERNGFFDLAGEYGCRVVAFDRLAARDVVRMPVPDPVVFPRIPLGRPAVDADVVVSIAKLKIHSLARVTLSLKNLFGLVPGRANRVRIHPSIQRALDDIVQVVPIRFALVDGIVGNARLEVASHPVTHGIILAGWDPVAVDAAGARCMGIDPADVEHLARIAARRGFDLTAVKIDGTAPEELAIPYREGSRLLRAVQSAAGRVTEPVARATLGRG